MQYHTQQEQHRGERIWASENKYSHCLRIRSPWDAPAGCQRNNTAYATLMTLTTAESTAAWTSGIGISSDEALTSHTATPSSLCDTHSWILRLLDPHSTPSINHWPLASGNKPQQSDNRTHGVLRRLWEGQLQQLPQTHWWEQHAAYKHT